MVERKIAQGLATRGTMLTREYVEAFVAEHFMDCPCDRASVDRVYQDQDHAIAEGAAVAVAPRAVVAAPLTAVDRIARVPLTHI